MSHMHHEAGGMPAQGRAVGRVGIIGANPIGIGVAMSLLDANVPVTLFELAREPLASGIALARAEENGRSMDLLAGTVNFHHLKDCDLIVDAVPADTAGKEKLFRRLDQVAKPGAVLLSHAPDAGVDRIAGCTRRAGDVLGLHFGGAADAQAWHIVPGKDTSSDTLDTVMALARKLRKSVTVCDAWRPAGQPAGGAAWEIEQAQD